MSNPPTLAKTLDQAWHLLSNAQYRRLATLATLDTDGAPQARMVALRQCDRMAGVVAAQTDLLSTKIDGLRRDPRASLHIWQADALIQLRLTGTIQIKTGDPVADLWHRVPDASREAYGHVPAPGTVIKTADDWRIEPSQDRFAVLEFTIRHIDVVTLDPDGHRRAAFDAADGWLGNWLSP